MKRRHMAHHFHDETGNFGITTFLWDRLFGTFYDKASDRPRKSPTVFNLGYTPDVAEVYPYVAELSGGVATDHPRERDRAKALKIVLSAGADGGQAWRRSNLKSTWPRMPRRGSVRGQLRCARSPA